MWSFADNRPVSNRDAGENRSQRRRTRRERRSDVKRRLTLQHLEDRRVMTSFTPGANFAGVDLYQSLIDPPGVSGATGPAHVVEMVNGRYQVFSKAGGMPVQDLSLNDFWTTAGIRPTRADDPRVAYDPTSQRWFAVAEDDQGAKPNLLMLAVSSSDDPTQGWIALGLGEHGANIRYAADPKIGFDKEVVTIAMNMFDVQGDNVSVPATVNIVALPKADLVQANPTVAGATWFENLDGTTTGFYAQPATSVDGHLPRSFLSSSAKHLGQLNATTVTGPQGALSVSSGSVAVTPTNGPPSVDQPDTDQNIWARGDIGASIVERLMSGRVNPSLWVAHGINYNNRAAVEWYEIDAVTKARLQGGVISDPTLGLMCPSIAVNSKGDVVIGVSGADATHYLSSYVAVGHTINNVTHFGPVTEIKAGSGAYQLSPLWGTFSSTVVDPVDEDHFWTFQQYTQAADRWGTQITEIVITPGPKLFARDATVAENAGLAQFEIFLTEPAVGDVTFSLSTADGMAVAGRDYVATNVMGKIAAGATSTTVTVPIANDVMDEFDETFSLVVSNLMGAVAADDTAVATIVDDDFAPGLIAGDVQVAENDPAGKVAFTVRLQAISGKPVTFEYYTTSGSDMGTAVPGLDYKEIKLGKATIPAGAASTQVLVDLVNDYTDDFDKDTFSLAIFRPVNAYLVDRLGVATILDDDPEPYLYVNRVNANDVTVDESVGTATFSVAMTWDSDKVVTFDYTTLNGSAMAGTDFVATSGVASIPPRFYATKIAVPIVDNAVYELTEDFSFVISQPVNGRLWQSTSVVTIMDNDPPPLLAISDVTLAEGSNLMQGTVFRFTVSLSAATAAPFTVDYATAPGSAGNGSGMSDGDFVSQSGRLSFMGVPGETREIDVLVRGDLAVEANETFFVQLANVAGGGPVQVADAEGQGTIVNDDATGITSIGGQLRIVGTDVRDVISVRLKGNDVEVSIAAPNVITRRFALNSLTSIAVATMGGDDSVTVDARVPLPLSAEGGDGNDVLQAGGGSAKLFGGLGNDTLTGGNAADALMGGPGIDTLRGFKGNDLLIGGLGSDELDGGENDDILIGGTTAYDFDYLALDRIMTEWSSARTVADRVNNLRGANPNAPNSPYYLTGGGVNATVFDDAAADGMRGGLGNDWFFAKLNDIADILRDAQIGDLLEQLP